MRHHKNFIQFLIMVFFVVLSTHGVYADDPPPIGQSKSTPSSIPKGQSKGKPVSADEGISSDIFGKQGGNFHPFLIFQEIYTDNIFATDTHTKSDFITTIAPGVWLAFPANREKLLNIDTETTSPPYPKIWVKIENGLYLRSTAIFMASQGGAFNSMAFLMAPSRTVSSAGVYPNPWDCPAGTIFPF
ncbi:MAG: hypothetical protein A2350_08120 [Candidatus Raymondbacteria bacterium RifOxyB12_full_50_8]|nr:MAG: hypothetical protein A2350_08120 [Candidatus Raymondbacteria bacterium RifOxyB12_full_50_8]